MVMLFPVVAVPVAMAVPIAVAVPSGCDDDDGGRRCDHDSTGDTHVNAYIDVCSMCGTDQLIAAATSANRASACFFMEQSPKYERVLRSDFVGQQKTRL
jgi:hypothetical protein